MPMSRAARNAFLAVTLLVAAVTIPASPGLAAKGFGGIALPGPVTTPSMKKIVPLAKRELSRKVAERRGNNVPRYRNGKGRIAPYSIRDQWCAAFSTWIWSKSGFKSYLGTNILWKAFDGTMVAVQVRDLTNWAKREGYFSYMAKPGYLVAYGATHIGIVEKIDRKTKQAVGSIEGNIGDRVKRVTVPMSRVTGYISPVRLTQPQLEKSAVYSDMPVPAPVLEEITRP